MTLVIAHRGASAYAPENTMPAFELAAQQGADMIELDVQRTADGHLIVFHDETTEQWNGKKDVITEMSWSDLRQVDIRGAPVPLLSEVLQFARAQKIKLNIELKGYQLAEPVAQAIHEHQAEDLILISSFVVDELVTMSKVAPRLPLGYLMGTRTFRPDVRLRESWPFRALQKVGATAWHPTYLIPMVFRVIPRVRRMGYRVNVWTVNDEAVMNKLIQLGVDGIITDKPDVLRHQLHHPQRIPPHRRGRWRRRGKE